MAWTIDTLYTHFTEVLKLRDGNEASKFAAVEQAVILAKESVDHRLAGLNELRKLVEDHDRRYASAERVTAAEARLELLEKRFEALTGERSGVAKGWGVLVGVVGMLFALIGVALAVWSALH